MNAFPMQPQGMNAMGTPTDIQQQLPVQAPMPGMMNMGVGTLNVTPGANTAVPGKLQAAQANDPRMMAQALMSYRG